MDDSSDAIHTPTPAERAVWDRFFTAASAAIEAGLTFAEAREPRLHAELVELCQRGFHPRLVVQRAPLLTATLQVVGFDEAGERAAVDIFKFVGEGPAATVN